MPLKSVTQFSKGEYYAARDALLEEENNSLQPTEGQPDPAPELDPTLDAAPETAGNFSRGFSSGVDNMQALYGGGKALLGSAFNNEEMVADGMAYYREKQAEAQQNLPDSTFGDIDSASDFGAWAAYTLGSAVPDLAGMVVGGGLATLATKAVVKKGATEFAEKYAKDKAEALVERGISEEMAQSASKEIADKIVADQLAGITAKAGTVGAGLYAGQQGASSTFARTLEETGEEAPVAALASGTLQAAINAIPVGVALTKFLPKGKSDDAVEFISGSISDKGAWFNSFLKDVTAQSGMEGATEALQYVVEEEVISYVNNNFTENEKREYFDYVSNERKRKGIIEQAAGGTLFGFATGTAGASVKAATGGYDSDVNMGDGAKIIRTQSVNDPEFGARIREMYDRAKDDAANGRTSLGEMVPSERPIDPVTGELATTWNAEGALDPETNRPYTEEQLNQARLLDFNAAEEPIDIPDGDLPEPAVSADTQNTGFGENTLPPSPQPPQSDIVADFKPAPAFGGVAVSEGARDAGPAHRWDGELSPVDQPVQEQLMQLSMKAATPEAMDPNNTDVIVEAIDQDDVDRIFDRNESLKIATTDKPKGKSLPTIDEVYGDDAAQVTNSVAGVMADLSASGVPTSFMDSVSGVYVHKESEVDAPALTGRSARGISVNEDLLSGSLTDSEQLSELAWTMTHEVYHAADFAMGLSDKDSRFGIEIDETADAPTVVMGDIMQEIYDNWMDGTAVGERFDYPFNNLADDILDVEQDNAGLNVNYREEVFAQLGALFHSNPKQLQELAPQAYNYIKDIRDSNLQTAVVQETANEPSPSQENPDTTQPEGISGEVRAPPESGSIEVVQPEPTGSDGEASLGDGRADTSVEGQVQEETGQRERPEVQESEVEPTPATSIEAADPDRTPVVLKATDKKPTFKKATNYEETGNYIVTFADGDRYTLYFDDDAKEAGDEVYFTSDDGKIAALDGMLGETKQETIDELVAHRQKLIDAGENSYNLPLDPQVGVDIEFKAWSFIDDKGEVTEKQLRTKFKSLEDNQFENLKQRLLDENKEEEDTVTLQDGKFMSYEYLQEKDLDSLQDLFDDPSFIKKGAEYLLQKSKGSVGAKETLPVVKITPTTKDPEMQIQRAVDVVAKHPDALSSPEAWLAFERDLTGKSETLAPPYGLIRLYNDMDSWVETHAKLTPEQLDAANRGLATAERMGALYASGDATPNATAKLLLWGLMSRRQTASGQEAGFVDLMTGSTAVSDLAQKALDGDVSDADVKAWVKQVGKLIPDGSFGRGAISNANDFGKLMQKLAEPHNDGQSKLQRVHDIMADSDMSTQEVRRQFQSTVQGSGIDNKVFSFAQLMIGRDDVVILDRIQLNSMWDSDRYGKNIYADLADEFSGLRGSARYEAIENSLNTKLKQLYTKLGRPEDASIGRYHWESWVRDSGQIVAHPTMQGLEKDILGKKNPYAFIGAPEGKGDMYRSAAIYARDDKGTPYYVYPKSSGKMYKFSKEAFRKFLDEIPKPKNGIVPKDFKVSEFDKGTPWYESEQVSRQKLDELVDAYSEREAAQREYASERAVEISPPNGAGRLAERKRVYKELRSPRLSDSGSGANEGSIPRRFRRGASKYSQVLVAGKKVSGKKRELETGAKAALAAVDSFNGTVIELAKNKTNAKLFASKIQEGKDANLYGAAVYVYPESEYQKMQMFMTEDGAAGIAIENGDTIVSLYNNGGHKNVTYSLASLAVEEGGLYSDAFDTQLPIIYEDVGFKVISRLKWDDSQAPADWDKRTFMPFNKGEPDVVFMVVDPKYFGPYTKDTGYYVDTYEEGMRSIRETRRPEQERISPKLKQAVQDRIDRNITAAELNDIFRLEGRYVKPMHPEMIAPLKPDSHYINALKKTNREGPNTPSKETYWLSNSLVDGQRTGSRLDIPAHSAKTLSKDERADVVTAHAARPRKGDAPFAGAAGTRLGYYPTLRLDNALFASPQKGATNIAMGAEKWTIATIEGDYVAVDHEQNRLDFIAAMDDPAWTQVSMNPERHTFFYDLATQTPVESASQVIQVGNLVIAKDVVYDDVESFSYIKKKKINKETGTLDDGSPSTNAFSYNDEIDAQSDLARRLKGKKVYRSLVDRYAPLEDFENQAADFLEMGRLPAGLSPRDQENLSHGKVQNDLDAFHENYVDPLGDLIAELQVDPDAVGTYLIAKHAAERNDVIAAKVKAQRERNIARTEREIERLLADVGVDHSVALETQRTKLNEYQTLPLAFQDTGSGMTYAEAGSVLALAEREGTKADMDRIADKVYEMLQYQRDRMVEAGLLDEDSRSDWEDTYEFYVPLKGFAAEENGDAYKSGDKSRGFSIVGSESMRAKGRKTLPVNPLLTAIEDVQRKIIRARKNETAQILLELLSELGNSDSYTIYNNKFRPPKTSDELTQQDLDQMSRDVRPNGDPKYVEVKKGGQTFFIEFKSDSLNHALQNMSVPMLSRANDDVSKLLTLATRFQTFRRNMLINYNPSWGLVNPLRDIQTGLMYSLAEKDKKGSRVQGENLIGKMAQSYLPSMRSMYRVLRGKPVREGTLDQYAAEFVEDGASTGMMLVRDQDEQLRILKNKLKKGMTREALRAVGNWVEDFNTTMENSIRLSAYIEARKAGTDRQTAATLAKDLTVNFNRKGENTAVVNAGYLFFNAAVQGNVNIAQALGGGSGKVTTAQKTAVGLIGLGAAIAVINILNSEDDDDGEKVYADLPEHAKNRALLINYSSDEGFALPAPYGYNFFTNIGRLSAEMAFDINTPEESAVYLWENVLLNFVPVAPSSGDNWEEKARGFYPDLLEVHQDMLANKNFFGSDIYIEQNPFIVERSNAYNSRRSTDKAFTAAAEFLNDATGGDKYKDGYISMNPDKMEYVYEYFLGGVGRFVSQSSDVAARMMADEDFRKQDLPIVGTFFESPSEYEDRFEFYANWDETRKIEAKLKDAIEAGDQAELSEIRGRYQSFIPVIEGGRNSLYKMSNRDLRNISKTRKLVERQDIPEDRRKEMLDKLLENENKIFDIFNKAYRKAEREMK